MFNEASTYHPSQDINVEFDFRDINNEDYHGIKSLVSQIANGPLNPLTTLADPICEQANIGCVVTTEGGESGVCAFGTILNINQHKSNPGMIAVRALLKDFEKKSPKSARMLSRMLNPESDVVTGLVIKERLINSPFELAPHIHRVLIDDVMWSSSTEYEPEKNESREDYKFTHLLFLSSFETESSSRFVTDADPVNDSNQPPEGMGHKMKRKLDKKAAIDSRVYIHWEDEVFIEKAVFSHTWQNSAKSVVVRAGKKFHSFNLLYAIKWDDYLDLVDRLASA
jgi:hypothetical protein